MNIGNRHIEISGLNPAEIFGVNDANLRHIKTFFPKLKITARGNMISLNGDEEVMDEFERKFNLLIQHYHKFNHLTENNIDNLMLEDGSKLLSSDDGSEILVHGNGGAKIKARTVNQKKMVQAVDKDDMVFAVGPAGTGKTTLVASYLKTQKIRSAWVILDQGDSNPTNLYYTLVQSLQIQSQSSPHGASEFWKNTCRPSSRCRQ